MSRNAENTEGSDTNMFGEEQVKYVLDIERKLWNMPETGFKEYRSTEFMLEVFEKAGYQTVTYDGLTGFYADYDTGRDGPTIAVLGELDSLICKNHPQSDKTTGAVHACGHNTQNAMLAAVAIAMKNSGVAQGLCGKVRFVSVPAEELIEIGYREQLKERGKLKFTSGKPEFIYRGAFDGVDMAVMMHSSSLPEGKKLALDAGYNGCIAKRAVFHGRASHAGSCPQGGINALYAAMNALNAANALRETFTEVGKLRFHPIITEGGNAVNAIPDRVVVESYLRGSDIDIIRSYNEKINRAFAAAAASMGAGVTFYDNLGFFPLSDDANLISLLAESMRELEGNDSVIVSNGRCSACTDLGDLSTLMPVVQGVVTGTVGACHGDNFFVTDPYSACITSAKCVVRAVQKLLCDNGKRAKAIKAKYKPLFANKEEYIKCASELTFTVEGVTYNDDGTVLLKYKK